MTERPPIVGEVSAKFCGKRVPSCQRGSLRPYSPISRPKLLLFLRSSSLETEWTPFQTHYFSENLVASGIESGPLDL
jgi:hypothetical protein